MKTEVEITQRILDIEKEIKRERDIQTNTRHEYPCTDWEEIRICSLIEKIKLLKWMRD